MDEPASNEMAVEYKGHELKAWREDCLGGWELLYFTVQRNSDGYECVCSFEDSTETLADKIDQLKQRVDAELKTFDPWGEKDDWRD